MVLSLRTSAYLSLRCPECDEAPQLAEVTVPQSAALVGRVDVYEAGTDVIEVAAGAN
jgi:hypothetical protein